VADDAPEEEEVDGVDEVLDDADDDELDDEEDEDELALGEPGTPGWAAFGGGWPSGGVPLSGWDFSHDANCVGLTTRTVERISECPAPHSSVHSTG
jgi:hypothetical protein